MSVAIPQISWPVIHRQFVNALPQIERTLRYQFRKWPEPRRAEAIADARAATWHAWHGLLARGQDPMAVGPTGIAFNACRYVKSGRRLGTGPCNRSAVDVYHPRARKLGLRLISYDSGAARHARSDCDGWRARLASDGRRTPADEAAFRLDFAAWLAALPPRKRQTAELLAEGLGTGAVAQRLGVTPAAISQARTWLERSWREFQGEVDRGGVPVEELAQANPPDPIE